MKSLPPHARAEGSLRSRPRPSRSRPAGAWMVAVLLALCACKGKQTPADAAPAAPAAPAATKSNAAPAKPASPAAVALPAGPKTLADPIFQRLPRKVAAAWVFPHLESTGPLLRGHLSRFAALFGVTAEGVASFTRALAFGVLDPCERAEQMRFGLDGLRAFAMVVDPADRAPFVLLPVKAFATFERALRAQLGAGVSYEAATAHGKPLTLAKRGAEVIAAYADAGSYAVLAPGDAESDAKAGVTAALAVQPDQSLAQSPAFQSATRKLSAAEDLLVYFDGSGMRDTQTARAGAAIPEEEKRGLHRLFELFPGVAASVSFTQKDVVLEAYLSVAVSAQLAALFPKAEGFPLARFVDGDAIAALKGTLGGAALVERALNLDPSLKSRITQFSGELEPRLGISLERDVLRNVTGRLAFTLAALDPELMKVAMDPARAAQVVRHLHLVFAAELKDRAGMEKTLATAAKFLRKRPGAKLVVRERDAGAVRVRDFSLGGPTLFSAAIVDDVLLLSTGLGRLDKAVAAAAPGAAGALAATSELGKAFAADQNVVLSLRFDALVATLRALDLAGLGARGAEAKAFFEQRVYPALAPLSDLTAQARFDGQGVKVLASLRGK